MMCARICWLGFAIGQLLVWQGAFANDRAPIKRPSLHPIGVASRTLAPIGTHHAGTRHARTGARSQAAPRGARDDYRSGYVAGLHDGKHATVQTPRSRRDIARAEAVAIRERAERDARAQRIYRNSQLSAPIIPDAKACKRLGAHGESIYENCQLARR
jgi:hypothetical protein